MTQLPAEQEEALFDEWLAKPALNENRRDAILAFARLYHAQVSKTGMSGEVKTPAEVMNNYICSEDMEGRPCFRVNYAEAMMREYAAQFQERYTREEMFDAFKAGYLLPGSVSVTYPHFRDWMKDRFASLPNPQP